MADGRERSGLARFVDPCQGPMIAQAIPSTVLRRPSAGGCASSLLGLAPPFGGGGARRLPSGEPPRHVRLAHDDLPPPARRLRPPAGITIRDPLPLSARREPATPAEARQ